MVGNIVPGVARFHEMSRMIFFNRENFWNISNYTMNMIVLFLRLNFETRRSKFCNLELKYLTPEQEPINKIINSPS